MMNLISTVGATTSLELAIMMMASALLLDYRKNIDSDLWRSIAAILEAQDGPALDEPALDQWNSTPPSGGPPDSSQLRGGAGARRCARPASTGWLRTPAASARSR